ncbi:MAG: hypothetical protein ACOC95_10285 [Planctomycetota bacterium]
MPRISRPVRRRGGPALVVLCGPSHAGKSTFAARLAGAPTHRNYSPENIVVTFLHSNLREFGEHGAASKNWADAHLYCHDDYRLEPESISSDLYERTRDVLHEDVEAVGLAGLSVQRVRNRFHACLRRDGRYHGFMCRA